MIAHDPKKHKLPGPKPRSTDAPSCGYSEAARRLNVSPQHLHAVLTGKRASKKLSALYAAMFPAKKRKRSAA